MSGFGAYPDSVKRVSPPKTTMPKTLAALPRSQYATLLFDVSGNILTLVFPPDFSELLKFVKLKTVGGLDNIPSPDLQVAEDPSNLLVVLLVAGMLDA